MLLVWEIYKCNIRQPFKGDCCLASDLWATGKILMCHAAGGKKVGPGS